MAHESFDREEEVQGSSNRAFGIVFAVVFGIVGLLPMFSGGDVLGWALMAAALFLTAARPAFSTAPLNVWLRLGLVLHRVVNLISLICSSSSYAGD
jgi:hypothetical protein